MTRSGSRENRGHRFVAGPSIKILPWHPKTSRAIVNCKTHPISLSILIIVTAPSGLESHLWVYLRAI
ncbi:hypothetical protein GN244_ATG00629 [Phytophthora infestans]|uniref:Uncharacterized protein n=1 Tax=Phytophthora infestans TaxID=4787 RepID=A0A833TMR2_PHYIN|nr:hypothetical protein GN244_ATG00629 [Phytophthora infestans]